MLLTFWDLAFRKVQETFDGGFQGRDIQSNRFMHRMAMKDVYAQL